MKPRVRTIAKIGILAALLISYPAIAQSPVFETNVPGIVIKDWKCWPDYVDLTLVNRNERAVSGYLNLRAFDKDGDPVGSGSTGFSLGPVSGDKKRIFIANCTGNRLSFFIS